MTGCLREERRKAENSDPRTGLQLSLGLIQSTFSLLNWKKFSDFEQKFWEFVGFEGMNASTRAKFIRTQAFEGGRSRDN